MVDVSQTTPINMPELWQPTLGCRMDMPTVGSRLDCVELQEVLRCGTISQTFRGRHLKFDIPVAVKIIPVEGSPESDSFREMLQIEAIALARMNHSNVVRLWDVETSGPFPYLITEYVPGYTLARLIEQVGSLHPLLAVSLVRQAVEGLSHAREMEVIHRDVKPGNLIISKTGVLKLLDFGLALVGDPSTRLKRDKSSKSSPLTGTAAYLAPEQAIAPESVDHRADIYSLGATLYHALTGRLPFEAQSTMQMITKHLREDVVPPNQINPEVSNEVSEVVLRMLAKQVKDRFQDYGELRVALARAIGDRRTPRSQPESIMGFGAETT